MFYYRMLVCGLMAITAGAARAQTAAIAATAPADGDSGPARTAPAAPPVYFTADEMPAFPGGEAALLKFLSRRLNYPAAALERRLSGKVYLSFTVDPEGRLHDPRVVRGLGGGLDEEALRLVRLMPWWNPGKIGGQPVWVALTLPIVFRAL